MFYMEGIRFVMRAVQHRARLRTLVVAPELLTNPFGRKLAAWQRRSGTSVLEVSADIFRGLSHAAEPQGIGAVVRRRPEPIIRAQPDAGLCWVALDTVQSPGNLGTIIRTGEAVGAAGLILIGDSIDPFEPSAVRATMGSLFAQRLVRATPTHSISRSLPV
jgi:RNA methyltransferase, TrmH family